VPKLLVANNSELLRHLGMASFRRLGLEVVVASTGDDALELASTEKPILALLDAEMPGKSGYDATREIKQASAECRVVLVVGKRLTGPQMRRVVESGCDEVLVAPMTTDELYDSIAIQLGLPRRGSERFDIDLAVVSDDGERSIDGRVTNLSVDGARIVFAEPVADGARLRLTITGADSFDDPIRVGAQVVWSQSGEEGHVIGAAFDEYDAEARNRLARMTQWDIIPGPEKTRVIFKGDITEATSFDDLLPTLVGRIDFDLSQVGYINSLGVREWIGFLKRAGIQGYEFHACSIPFVLQASLAPSMLGRGTVTSFFAPYYCTSCERTEERLLQSAAVLAAEDQEPPRFACAECSDGAEMELDDIPSRYLAFLLQD